MLPHEAARRLWETCLIACKARGGSNARGPPPTDATHVLAAVRTLPRVEGVREALRHALHQLRETAPT